jgi:Na+-driven multidrug efflux pump
MKQALDTRTKLLTKNPWPLMIELSIPAVLGMVVVGLYNMMDSIFVGQMVGDVQMGAISVSYPLTLINAGSAAMLGVGSASVLSRAIGKKDENTIKKIMGNLVAMVLLLSVIYTVVGMVFTRQLLSLTGASDNILNYAEKYLRIVFAGSPDFKIKGFCPYTDKTAKKKARKEMSFLYFIVFIFNIAKIRRNRIGFHRIRYNNMEIRP